MASILLPDGYAHAKCVRESPRGAVYRAIRERDGRKVVLKTYHRGRSGQSDTERARLELDALTAAAGAGVPVVLEQLLRHSPPLIVLEYVPGISLSEWCSRRTACEPKSFLDIASQLAATLARVHASHLVHRGMVPGSVLVDPTTVSVHLISFGLARRLGAPPSLSELFDASRESVEALRYVAPEQTGRMNRGCDFRSDLYSLGCVFYLMLTGRPAFDGEDPLSLVHAHIARMPAPPTALSPDCPEVLSRLTLKLLSKEPAARYQSASALRDDLQALASQLHESGQLVSTTALAHGDAPSSPRFSSKLHGRDAEIGRMHAAYAASARGKTQLLVLSGRTGMGKSALVDTLRPLLASQGAHLATGKFDSDRDRPYSGWAGAIESLVEQLLVADDERLTAWSTDLRSALGGIARALVDLVPELGFVLGDTSAIPALGAAETHGRLSLALQRFMSAVATPEHPLVLFLDGLEHADSGSLSLIEELLRGVPTAALLAIGTLADPDRLCDLVDHAAGSGAPIEVVHLHPLGRHGVCQMLADALRRSVEDVASLAEVIERKTGNVPLFIRQFVTDVHDRGLLQHVAGIGWTWNTAEIAVAQIPNDALELITLKLGRLSDVTRRSFEIASCIGDTFDVDLLASLTRRTRVEVDRDILTLCDIGLLVPSKNGFGFGHEQVREAGRSGLTDAQQSQLHAEIAQRLLERSSEGDQLLQLVEHLNRGVAHLPDTLRGRVVELNLLAGKRALASGAGATAARYLAAARALAPASSDAFDATLLRELYLCSAEAAFACKEYTLGVELIDALLEHTHGVFERSELYAKRVRFLPMIMPSRDCAKAVLAALADVGIRWPLHPPAWRVRLSLRITGWLMRRVGADDCPPRVSACPRAPLAQIRLLAPAGPSLLLHDVNLVALASGMLLRTYLRYGYFTSPAYRLATFTAYSHILLGDADRARRGAQVALAWNEQVPDPVYGPRTEHVINIMVHPWLMPRRQALAPMARVADAIQETGDPEFVQYARFVTIMFEALAGSAVAETVRRFADHLRTVSRARPWFLASQRIGDAFGRLGEPVGSGELETAYLTGRDTTPAYAPSLSSMWMLVLTVYRMHALAFAESERMQTMIWRIGPMVHVADHTFYRGIAAAQLATETRGAERRRLIAALRASRRKLAHWARGGPDFPHMARLLEAEEARLRGRADRASALYMSAAERAVRQQFVHHAALAHELRAELLGTHNKPTAAGAALAKAARLYAQWGANGKCAALEERLSEQRDIVGPKTPHGGTKPI